MKGTLVGDRDAMEIITKLVHNFSDPFSVLSMANIQ